MELREKYVIKEKIVIKDKDDSRYIPKKNLIATLRWSKKVDLDLRALYRFKDGKEGSIYYGNKGSLARHPFIALDKDDGVGDVGGDNEENMRFKDLSNIEHILIVVNIFNKINHRFSDYDGMVIVSSHNGQGFEVPLTAEAKGSWCVVARVDNTDVVGPKLINVNQIFSDPPSIRDFTGSKDTAPFRPPIENVVAQAQNQEKGLFSKFIGMFK